MSRNLMVGSTTSPAALEAQGRSLYLYGTVLVECTGGFIFGFASFLISGVIISLTKEFSLTPSHVGFAIRSMTIGSLVGSGIAAISDQLGRRESTTIAALLWGASAIGAALSQNITGIYLFRILDRFGVAVAMLVSPIYVAEISPARFRGRLDTVNEYVIVAGAFSASFVCYGFSFSESWRWPLAIGVVPAIVLLFGLFFAPDSPLWLMEKGRQPEALVILNSATEAASLKEIMASHSGRERGSNSELFRPGIRMALVAAFQQITGAGMVAAFYAPVIFQRAGITSNSTGIGLSVCIFVSNLICVMVAAGLVNRVGRKPLLLWGTIGLGLGPVLLALILNLAWAPYLAVAAVIFIQVICNLRWGTARMGNSPRDFSDTHSRSRDVGRDVSSLGVDIHQRAVHPFHVQVLRKQIWVGRLDFLHFCRRLRLHICVCTAVAA